MPFEIAEINGRKYIYCPNCDIFYPHPSDEAVKNHETELNKSRGGGHEIFHLFFKNPFECPLCSTRQTARLYSRPLVTPQEAARYEMMRRSNRIPIPESGDKKVGLIRVARSTREKKGRKKT